MTSNKILLVQTAFIGDVILITPLIRTIKDLYPTSILDVMVIPQTATILDNNPHINKVILFNKRKNKIRSFIKALVKLRKEKYQVVFTPHSSMTTALLIYYAGIPTRVGFDRWKAKKYLTHKVLHLENKHKSQKNLELLKPFTEKLFSIQTELFPSKETYKKAIKLLGNISNNGNKIIAIAPGSVWFTKRWSIEHYISLSKKLLDENYNIVLVGSIDEKGICNMIENHKNLINLAGELSLLESAAIIDKCDLMICNDSGALHIANAMQTDVFAFFGPTVQSIGYYPFRNSDFVFELDMGCRPCGSHGGNTCHLKHHECMKLITPDIVFSKVKEKFN